MVVITYIYAENEKTKQMVSSFTQFGYEVAIVRDDAHRGNGNVLRLLYECYKRAATGHSSFMYADAADSFCQRKFFVPYDKIIYQTEKACYPHPHIADQYPETNSVYKSSPWKYLNGGGYCGSPAIMVEFMERYGLNKLPNEANGQYEQALAYIKAKQEGFPISLDDGCELMQSMAFEEFDDFSIVKAGTERPNNHLPYVLKNRRTNNIPAVLHFNGLTDMAVLNQLK